MGKDIFRHILISESVASDVSGVDKMYADHGQNIMLLFSSPKELLQ